MAGVTARATEAGGQTSGTMEPPSPTVGSTGAGTEATFGFLALLFAWASQYGSLLSASGSAAKDFWDDQETAATSDLPIMREVQMIGGAVITIAVIVIVVNEVLTVDAVANSTGPFSGVIDSIETTGVAAMTLLVVGLLVAAAAALMNFFRGGF